ncbi:fumarylacetoacetate hydrolase family protein [Bordetella hinzii]|uniref:FAH family protein n=1 Tax=Bordetella hinzii OH87 BAL007II TaxID=1331262 RepID=A0ABR4R2N0_9BORD|nr:fumarylacetoacetate hydrolase family protein [Bordetella hinzii]KCB24596.1 FAH family protein [Bordetella hinzii OH87 BAL007II]KCB39268.1 FAH family protein [Bordetella hinzii 5132]QDJ43351.1 2-keto-4-pentenoate hydratase [Bordetella hinzii]QDJ56811.1 2-keto-4-pentenoate hydratase [Bordetella hinzii]QWF38810.1 fumarylacetoacetate hydrolase family protein [Bordetella hinzii]
MRWIRYTLQGKTAYGMLDDNDRIVPVAGDPFGGYEKRPQRLALADVSLEVPVVPPTFYCVGLNYTKHISAEGMKIPNKPDVGYRANNALLPHEGEVIMPADAMRVHYEGELVVVIGKKTRDIEVGEAADCIFGYTIGNDVSERNWQAADRSFWRAKNSDTFKPMGPWISTQADIAAMRTTVSVNGKTTTAFDTADMLFGVEEFISTMSRYLTLHPGDMIWMGTDGHSPDLQDGDVVEVSLTGLGTLRNRFVRTRKI